MYAYPLIKDDFRFWQRQVADLARRSSAVPEPLRHSRRKLPDGGRRIAALRQLLGDKTPKAFAERIRIDGLGEATLKDIEAAGRGSYGTMTQPQSQMPSVFLSPTSRRRSSAWATSPKRRKALAAIGSVAALLVAAPVARAERAPTAAETSSIMAIVAKQPGFPASQPSCAVQDGEPESVPHISISTADPTWAAVSGDSCSASAILVQGSNASFDSAFAVRAADELPGSARDYGSCQEVDAPDQVARDFGLCAGRLQCTSSKPTAAVRRALLRSAGSKSRGRPRRIVGRVYLGRCSATTYAVASLWWPHLGVTDQPSVFTRQSHGWKFRGDTGITALCELSYDDPGVIPFELADAWDIDADPCAHRT